MMKRAAQEEFMMMVPLFEACFRRGYYLGFYLDVQKKDAQFSL